MSAETAADERWATARSLAEGVIDAGMPRRRRRMLLWIFALMLFGLVLGFVLSLTIPTDPSRRSGGDPSGFIAGLILLVLGLLTSLIGFIWAKRTGRYITRWKHVVAPLTFAERRWVFKQIRGKIEPDREKLPILVAFARQIQTTTIGVSPLLAGLVLIAIGTVLYLRDPVMMWIQVGVVVLFLIIGLLMVREYRLAGRFLKRHAAAVP